MYFFCALSRTLLHRKRQGISFQNIPCPSPCVHFNLLIILFLLIMIDQQSNHCKYCNSDNPCERILIPFCFCSFYILPGCLTAVLCVRVFCFRLLVLHSLLPLHLHSLLLYPGVPSSILRFFPDPPSLLFRQP